MPLTPKQIPKSKDSVPESLHRTNLQDFQKKAILYGIGTVAGTLFWIANRDSIPLQVAIPALGALGLEAAKNIKRWREWQQANPYADRMHPDRVAELQQHTVKVMSDAVKARAWFMRAIIACVAIPSLLEVFVGVRHAVDVAGVVPVAIRGGEWWRLLGGTYLHGDLGHFFGNMTALFLYGSILESKSSATRLPLVYLLSCLAGSFASVVIPPDIPSIGASGGVVGVIAYLFLFSRRQEVKFPAAFRGATAAVFVGLITAGALNFWYIDNPGHAGGALAGIVMAALIVDTARNFGDEIPLPLLDGLGWLAMAVIVAGSAITSLALLSAPQ